MKFEFVKMHGAGNDFVLFEMPSGAFPGAKAMHKLCDRRLGVGADGVLFVTHSSSKGVHAKMEYFNSDGKRAEMCGNGLRCAALYAHQRIGTPKTMKITTDAGVLEAKVTGRHHVTIQIPVVHEFRPKSLEIETVHFGDTGVPHAVIFVEDVEGVNIVQWGASIRNHPAFLPEGTNVNFVALGPGKATARIRTYERGVEDETFACGTGAAASAICLREYQGLGDRIRLITIGKDVLEVEFPADYNKIKRVSLTGPAVETFQGTIDI